MVLVASLLMKPSLLALAIVMMLLPVDVLTGHHLDRGLPVWVSLYLETFPRRDVDSANRGYSVAKDRRGALLSLAFMSEVHLLV